MYMILYKTKDVLNIQALRTLYQSLVEPYMSIAVKYGEIRIRLD